MAKHLITTWRSIADCLGKSITTVKRWTQTYPDFPIYREHGVPFGRVWTTREELTVWATRHHIVIFDPRPKAKTNSLRS